MAFHRRNSTNAPGPCGCGATHTGFACDSAPTDGTGAFGEVAQEAVLRAAFPQAATRRALINTLGAGTLFAALDSVFPLAGAREAMAQGGGAPEKRDLKIGFIPITCATPIIMADPMGFYKRNGLNVEVIRTAGWAVIRDKSIAREYDAAHMLSPMPVAMSLGVGVALTAAGVVSALSIFYTIMGVSLFVPILAGLFSRRAATVDALAAIVAGIAIVGGLKLWPTALSIAGVTPAMAGLAGSITAFFVVQIIRRALGGPDGPTRTILPSLSE